MSKTVNDGVKPNDSTTKSKYVMMTKQQLRKDIDAWCQLVESAYGLGHAMGQKVGVTWMGLSYMTFVALMTATILLHVLEIEVPFLGVINFLIMAGVAFFGSHMMTVQEHRDEAWEAERIKKLRVDLYEMQKLNETEDKEEDAVHDN